MNLRSVRSPLAATVLAVLAALRFSLPALSLAVLSLTACGEDSSTREEPPMPVEDTVFGDQVEAIQRVQEQTKAMEERNEDIDSQLEEVEGERPDVRDE